MYSLWLPVWMLASGMMLMGVPGETENHPMLFGVGVGIQDDAHGCPGLDEDRSLPGC